MNRRSVLRWLGLAPVAAPAAVAAAGQAEPVAPAVLPRRFTGMFLETLPDGSTRIVFDANLIAFSANGGHTYPFTFDERNVRMPNQRIQTVEQRLSGAESRIGMLVTTAAG